MIDGRPFLGLENCTLNEDPFADRDCGSSCSNPLSDGFEKEKRDNPTVPQNAGPGLKHKKSLKFIMIEIAFYAPDIYSL